MHKYYLDTVALRSLSPFLDEKPEVCEISYSSLFAVIEIFKGISKKDGLKRINILNNLLKISLPIIKELPNHILLKPYGIDHPDDEKDIADILSIINKIKDAKSLDEFDAIKKEHHGIFASLLDCYDSLNIDFINVLSARNCVPDKKETFVINDLSDYIITSSEKTEAADSEETKKTPRDCFLEYIKPEFVRNFSASILKNQGIVSLLGTNNIRSRNEQINHLASRYSGTQLDEFALAITIYCMKKKCRREASAKNDILDILHTLYLYEPDQILVSDDKIFEDIIIPSEKLMKINDFKKLFS